MKAKFNGYLTIPYSTPVTAFGRMNIKNCFFLSGEGLIGNFTLSSEYMELPVALYLDLFGQELEMSDETMQGYYVMGSYVFGDTLTLYAYYDQFYSDKGDTEGQSAVLAGLPNYFGWQKDLVLGARFDVSFNWTIKAECHLINGVSKSAVFFPDFQDAKKDWQMIAVKVSYNF